MKKLKRVVYTIHLDAESKPAAQLEVWGSLPRVLSACRRWVLGLFDERTVLGNMLGKLHYEDDPQEVRRREKDLLEETRRWAQEGGGVEGRTIHATPDVWRSLFLVHSEESVEIPSGDRARLALLPKT